MTAPMFAKDYQLGRPLSKRKREALLHPEPEPVALPERVREWPDTDRIVIGGAYKRRMQRHVGECCAWQGGLSWDETKPACWHVRTLATMTLRVRKLAYVDSRLGPCYHVSPVKPDLWQMRAWAGGDMKRGDLEGHPEKWHTVSYIVPGDQLGERVDGGPPM